MASMTIAVFQKGEQFYSVSSRQGQGAFVCRAIFSVTAMIPEDSKAAEPHIVELRQVAKGMARNRGIPHVEGLDL